MYYLKDIDDDEVQSQILAALGDIVFKFGKIYEINDTEVYETSHEHPVHYGIGFDTEDGFDHGADGSLGISVKISENGELTILGGPHNGTYGPNFVLLQQRLQFLVECA